jgi:hypothetical protein
MRVGLLHGRVLLGEERAVCRDCQDAGLRDAIGRSQERWQFTGRRRCVPRFGSGESAAP